MTRTHDQNPGKRATPLMVAYRRYIGIFVVCSVAMIVSEWFRLHGVLVPKSVFLPLHTVLEFSSIVVSFAVFVTGWFGYRQTRNSRALFLGIVFLATGAIDFVHTFTYQGMPAFLGVSEVAKSTAFWTIARLIAGAGFLTAMYLDPRSESRWLRPRVLLVSAIVIVTGLIALVIHFYPHSGRLFYDIDAGGLTRFKIGLEYLVVLLYALAFWLAGKKLDIDSTAVVSLRGALLLAMFAELAFTMYVSPYSPMNFLGHLLKTSAYYLILGALFISSIRRPYEELSTTKEELQALYADAQEHRREIERSFTRIGSALSSSLKLEEALNQIADLAIGMLHADYSVVMSLTKSSGKARVVAERGSCHEPARPAEIALRMGKQAIAQGTSVIDNDLKSAGLIDCEYTYDNCLRSIVLAPMYYQGDALGVIAIYSHSLGAFDQGDRKLLEAFASHAGIAIHNAMSYERESRIADVLQRSLLTPAKTVLDGYEIAQVYASALEESQVGGDFYDVITLGEDRIALVIGDVSGKGLAAAVHTALAKYSLRAYLSEGHSLSTAISLLSNAVAEVTHLESFITMFCGVLNTRTREMTYVNAGHEPALYSAGEGYVMLESTGPILGLGIDLPYVEKTITLERDSVLLLYTDGISEARRNGALLGTERVGERLVDCREFACDDVAQCIYQSAADFCQGDLRDDVAILALKVTD